MCWKEIFGQKPSVQPELTDHSIINLGISNFPPPINDLEGCVNDGIDFNKKVTGLFPQFICRRFADRQVTVSRFLSEITSVVDRMKAGDLLFFIMDTCFSETNTKNFISNPSGPKILGERFYLQPGQIQRHIVQKTILSRGKGIELPYISFSACQDYQTAADAEFNGRANGAWHYALIHTLEIGITYIEWFYRAKAFLAQYHFSQIPAFEGANSLLQRKVFEGPTYVIDVSTHGSQGDDVSGDEPDGYDELIVAYDGFISDDQLGEILQKVPA